MDIDKILLSPFSDDHSTKKAKFRAQGDDGDNPQQQILRDKLMGSRRAIVQDLTGHDDDLDFDPMDVVFYSSNNIPSIFFS